MGGSQSQEKVVTVEQETSEEDGSPQIRITDDFAELMRKKLGEEGYSVDEEEDEESIPDSTINPATATERCRRMTSDRIESERWRRKYEMEKEKNKNLKNITSKEMDRTSSDIRDILTTRVPKMVPVCEDLKNKVSDCYHHNPNKSLMCYSEVQEYMQCVRKARGDQLPSQQQQ